MKIFKSIFCLFILFYCFSYAFSQNQNLEQLEIKLQSSESNEEKVELLTSILDSLQLVDSIKINSYLKQLKILSDNSGESRLILAYYNQLAKTENLKTNYQKSFNVGQQAIDYLSTKKDEFTPFEFDSIMYNFMQLQTIVNSMEGLVSKSLEQKYQLIEFIDKANNTSPSDYWTSCHYKNYYSIARDYLFDNDSLSLLYANKAIEYARKSKSDKNIFASYNMKYYSLYFSNDGKVLNEIADSCIYYAEKLNIKDEMGESYMHKCNALVELNLIEAAEIYCSKAETIFRELSDPRSLSSHLNNIANVFMKVNAIEKALPYYEKSYVLAIELKEPKEYLTSLKNLADKYRMINNHELSNSYYKIYTDSLENYQTRLMKSGFLESDAKYQASEKEKEIVQQALELEKKQNTQNKIIGGGILLLLLTGGIYQWYYSRQKIKKTEAEQALELKQQEADKLKELDEMKSQFFTNVSHELRTPLTLISGPLQNAIPRIKDKIVKDEIKLAHSNSKKLLSLINEILDLSKLESGEIELRKSAINLNGALKRIFGSFESLAELRDISLQYESQIKDDLYCDLDLKKFEKIINNLVANAIKFSDHDSSVILKAAITNNNLELSVIDTGEGIRKAEQDKIFDRFYQSKNVKATVGGGTGVGLALTKEYVELMGGKIWVESTPDLGSTFSIKIPIEMAEPSSEEIITEGIATDKNVFHYSPILLNGEKPKILVVEDNEDMSNYINQILSEYYKCSFAIDGFEAIKMIQKEKFDLISSDVMMPRMDGFQLKEKINEFDKFNHTPFIFLTARALEEDKLRGLNLGVDDYITKPFNENEYRVRIHNLLKNKKEREKYLKENQGLFKSNEIDSSDISTLKKAEKIVIQNISNPAFKIKDLADEMSYSQRQLSRIIKKLTGLPPVGFILELRLQRAYHLMKSKHYHTVSEVRYEVGIESASYFTNKFKKRFGLNPTDILTG